jgi:hypothetical protein
MAVILAVDLTEQIKMLAPAVLTQVAAEAVFNQPPPAMERAATAALV